MEFVWFIIGIIWFVVSISNKAKKEQEKQRQQANRKAQPIRPAQQMQTSGRGQAPRSAIQPAQRNVVREAPRPVAPAAPPHAMEHQTVPVPLEAHMHTPVMGGEGTGTEGIDCCHEYMLTEPADKEEILPLFEEDQTRQERAQQLLQGVIMSEILGRRRVRQYGSRRA